VEYKSLICIIIYYAFLCIENGRIALHELTEDSEFLDESMFIALAQDLRAYTFLLIEANEEEAIRPFIRHRLRERLKLGSESARRHDPKENYLYSGYAGGFQRMKRYIEDLGDPRYVNDLYQLFGDDMKRLFGPNYAQELSNRCPSTDAERPHHAHLVDQPPGSLPARR
jgi:hypothetical protein